MKMGRKHFHISTFSYFHILFIFPHYSNVTHMLKNYFKIAIAVLKRRKFFTFISLFGISFTLTIIIIVAALTDHVLSAGYPDTDRDRELFVTRMKYKGSKNGSSISAGPSFYFFDHYV